MSVLDKISCFLGFHYKKFSIEKYPDKTYTIIAKCIKCGLEEHRYSGNGFEKSTRVFIKMEN